MPTFTQKYTIIQLLEDMPDGTQFAWTDWPLHVTLVDVFAIDWGVPRILEKLGGMLRARTPVSSVGRNHAFFGAEQQTKVVLLQKTESLMSLHNDLVTLLNAGGLEPNSPQFVGEGFLPHVTVQKHTKLKTGDIVTFDALSLIDMFPNNDPYQRKIIATKGFGKL